MNNSRLWTLLREIAYKKAILMRKLGSNNDSVRNEVIRIINTYPLYKA